MNNKNKVILYLSGGGMSGVFTAGVLCKLQEADFYGNIEAIYSASAGTLNAAYFLAGQSEYGSTIYWENNGFINTKALLPGILQRTLFKITGKMIPKKPIQAMDPDYLIEILKNTNKLDLQKMLERNVNFYCKLVDIDSGEIRYFNMKKCNQMNIFKAAVTYLPYCYNSVLIEGRRYADSCVSEAIGVEYLMQKYPESKIVVIFNGTTKRNINYKIKDKLEYFGAWLMNLGKIKDGLRNYEENLIKEIYVINKNKEKIMLINPQDNIKIKTWTLDRDLLLKAHAKGKEEAEKIMHFANE